MLETDLISINSQPMITQKGFGIISAIFLILLMSMLTVFSVSLYSTDIQISLDSMRSAQALFMCEGAMEYCIKNEIKDDADWSDNADTIDKPLGRGTFSVFYDPNTTASKTTLRLVSTVNGITRQVTRSFERGWPDDQADFPYSLFTADDLTIKTSPGLAIQTPYEVNNSNCPSIACDLGYYATIADINMPGNWELSSDPNRTFNGIIYVTGIVGFYKCNNLTINGTIVATSDIMINGCKGVTIIPSGNYPALVSASTIQFGKSGAVSCENIDIQGTVFSDVGISITAVSGFEMTGILYSGQDVDISNTNNFQIAGSIITQSGVTFDTCGGTGPVVNWGSKVLEEPPGFSWPGALNMGTWEEVY